MLLDTGSVETWIPSSHCLHNCENKHQYHSSLSSTHHDREGLFEIHYGSGDVYGLQSEDDFHIGDLMIQHQHFGEIIDAQSMGELYKNTPFDGILGLKPSNNSFLSNLFISYPQFEGIISFNLFSLDASTESDQFIIGGFESSGLAFTYPDSHWMVIVSRYRETLSLTRDHPLLVSHVWILRSSVK